MDGRANPLMDRKVVVIFGVGHLTHNCRMQCGVAKCNVIVVIVVAVVDVLVVVVVVVVVDVVED